jgi:hypothetical protein
LGENNQRARNRSVALVRTDVFGGIYRLNYQGEKTITLELATEASFHPDDGGDTFFAIFGS